MILGEEASSGPATRCRPGAGRVKECFRSEVMECEPGQLSV